MYEVKNLRSKNTLNHWRKCIKLKILLLKRMIEKCLKNWGSSTSSTEMTVAGMCKTTQPLLLIRTWLLRRRRRGRGRRWVRRTLLVGSIRLPARQQALTSCDRPPPHWEWEALSLRTSTTHQGKPRAVRWAWDTSSVLNMLSLAKDKILIACSLLNSMANE